VRNANGQKLSARSVPTGVGSRGGKWHLPAWRARYQRGWREANPEYRDRERLRMARTRATQRGEDPGLILARPARLPRLPDLVAACACVCGCVAEIVRICGFCTAGLHEA
jgi:hypothetical protein